MAAYKKFPKTPKAGASLETLQRYKAKCMEIKKHNDAIDKEKAQKTKLREEVRKMKSK